MIRPVPDQSLAVERFAQLLLPLHPDTEELPERVVEFPTGPRPVDRDLPPVSANDRLAGNRPGQCPDQLLTSRITASASPPLRYHSSIVNSGSGGAILHDPEHLPEEEDVARSCGEQLLHRRFGGSVEVEIAQLFRRRRRSLPGRYSGRCSGTPARSEGPPRGIPFPEEAADSLEEPGPHPQRLP